MKSKLVAMAGGFASVCIAVTSLAVNAEEINNAVSGSTICLDFNPNGTCARSVSNTVSIPLKNNGKKYNKVSNTGVGHSALTGVTPDPLDPTTYCLIDDQPGLLFIYDYATGVGTTPNGDLIGVALDASQTSTVCVNPVSGNSEIALYRNIIGGTGQYEGACGSTEFHGGGVFLPPGTAFSAFTGTSVGEVLFGDDCPSQ